METPIIDFLEEYAVGGTVRAHMPGHKGRGDGAFMDACLPYDITEIHGADSLYEADGIIRRSEDNAAALFGAAATLYSAAGSTLAIQTMLAAASAGRHGSIVAARNAHISFINAAIFLGLDVEWVYPSASDTIVSGAFNPSDIEAAILSAENPFAVYITSPDYLGYMSDIPAISLICKKYNLLLLVDAAHGTHLAFLPDGSSHALSQGADMCCNSAHKSIPYALTGCAYLHLADAAFARSAKLYMSMFGSSSPSYLALASLDRCNKYLSESLKADLASAVYEIDRLKCRLSERYRILNTEPLHLTISADGSGHTGCGLAAKLRSNGIECEYADESHLVLMLSPSNTRDDYERIFSALNDIKFCDGSVKARQFEFPKLEKCMPMRTAALSICENVSVDVACGRIAAVTRTHCPPCVPIAVSGEKISAECINIFKRYSISDVNVIK